MASEQVCLEHGLPVEGDLDLGGADEAVAVVGSIAGRAEQDVVEESEEAALAVADHVRCHARQDVETLALRVDMIDERRSQPGELAVEAVGVLAHRGAADAARDRQEVEVAGRSGLARPAERRRGSFGLQLDPSE